VRLAASGVLATAAVAVFVGSVIWAWSTFDFWETGPFLGSVFGVGTLAALALYVGRRRVGEAIILGLAGGLVTAIATYFVTARWAR
jgi:hypothetical protein